MNTPPPPPQISDSPAEALQLDAPTLDEAERKKVLSGFRLKVTLIALIVLIIAGLSTMVFVMVTNIFDSLTPSVRRDLLWKTERGVAELSRSTELGIAAEDPDTIAEACEHFTADQDVLALLVQDAEGRTLFLHGKVPAGELGLFARDPNVAHEGDGDFGAWAPAEIEGVPIGKVALVVSTERLEAGLELRHDIQMAGLGGALFALLAALAFVNLHIGPLLRMTEKAFLQLERTTELALESARLKSQFLANMSHEIRTPMNGVLGMTRLILDMPLDGKLRRYVETVEASGRALLTIINDILDFSKIEAGKYKIQNIEFDLRLVTQEVAELLAERAHAKRLELVYRVGPDVPSRIIGDPDRYRQVVTNLVGNAIKFTEQGEVFVEITQTGDAEHPQLLTQVTDTGIGIAPDALGKIFEAFSQEDGSTARAYGGTGLGLAISKRMVEMMGGEIRVSSQPRQGSCFEFSLPLRAAASQPPDLAPIEPTGRRALLVDANAHARGVVEEHLLAWGMACSAHASGRAALEELERGHSFDVALIASQAQDMDGATLLGAIREEPSLARLPIVLLSQLGVASTPSELSDAVVNMLSKPIRLSDLYDTLVGTFSGVVHRRKVTGSNEPTAHVKGAKILVVDDNEINQFVAAEQVEQFGYAVELARNGREAVDAVARGGLAAVLMDCQMPVMDGYDATREIRASERGTGQRLPIIALTAHALMGERDKVLEAGMDDYLTKPIRADALRKVLARLVRNVDAPSVVMSGRPAPRASSSPPEQPHLDPATQRSPRVTELFLEHIPKQLADLRRAALAGDHAATRAQAHKLKGSCVSFGAWCMAPVAERLQHADDEALANAPEQVDLLEELFEGVVNELNPPRPSSMPSTPAPASSDVPPTR